MVGPSALKKMPSDCRTGLRPMGHEEAAKLDVDVNILGLAWTQSGAIMVPHKLVLLAE